MFRHKRNLILNIISKSLHSIRRTKKPRDSLTFFFLDFHDIDISEKKKLKSCFLCSYSQSEVIARVRKCEDRCSQGVDYTGVAFCRPLYSKVSCLLL